MLALVLAEFWEAQMNMDGASRKRRRPPSPPRPWDDGLGTGIDHVARSLAGKALAEELIDMYLVGGRRQQKHCAYCVTSRLKLALQKWHSMR